MLNPHKFLYSLLIGFIPFFTHAQINSDISQELSSIEYKNQNLVEFPENQNVFRKNIIKVNLSSFALYNNSLSYERSLSRKISFVAGYRYMPETNSSHIPLLNKPVSNFGEREGIDPNDIYSFTTGNNTLTSEIRFYGGKKSGPFGFYLSIYGRYMELKMAYPDKYETESRIYTIPYKGKLNGFAVGLMIGAQWLITKRLALDWYILGGHYGSLKVNIPALSDLSSMTVDEKQALKIDIDSFNENLGRLPEVNASVTDHGVTIGGSIPYLGIRGFGINVGFAF